MAKEKTKSKDKKTSKKKSKSEDTKDNTPVVETPALEALKPSSKKRSLLPSSVANPLEQLKRRVETLESAIANILLFLDKK